MAAMLSRIVVIAARMEDQAARAARALPLYDRYEINEQSTCFSRGSRVYESPRDR